MDSSDIGFLYQFCLVVLGGVLVAGGHWPLRRSRPLIQTFEAYPAAIHHGAVLDGKNDGKRLWPSVQNEAIR